MVNYVFRLDFNSEVGVGHLARCSYLSEIIFRRKLGNVYFCVSGQISFPSFLKTEGIVLVQSCEDEEVFTRFLNSLSGKKILFYDSYNLKKENEQQALKLVDCMVVIDDLANREHSCDILIDCGFHRKPDDYRQLVPTNTQILIGLNYCFIPEDIKKIKNDFVSKENRMHVFFGGGVENLVVIDFFSKLKKILTDYCFNVAFTKKLTPEELVVVNSLSGPKDLIYAEKPLSDSLSGCCVAIGSPGISTWERCYLGIPSFYIATNPNQIDILQSLERLGICRFLGSIESDFESILFDLKQFIHQGEVTSISKNLTGLIDGKGIDRIIDEVLKKI